MTAYTVEIAALAEGGTGAEVGRMLVRVNIAHGSARITDVTLRGGLNALPAVDLDMLLRAVTPHLMPPLDLPSDGPSPSVASRMWTTRRNGRGLRIRRAGGRSYHVPNACRCST